MSFVAFIIWEQIPQYASTGMDYLAMKSEACLHH